MLASGKHQHLSRTSAQGAQHASPPNKIPAHWEIDLWYLTTDREERRHQGAQKLLQRWPALQVSCGLLSLSTRAGFACISHKGSSLQMSLPAHQNRSRQLQTLQHPSSQQVCGADSRQLPGVFGLHYIASCHTRHIQVHCAVDISMWSARRTWGQTYALCAVHCMLACVLGIRTRCHFLQITP